MDSVEELAAAAAAARRLERRAHVRLRLRPDLTDLETTSEFTERDPLGAVADAYKPGIPIDGLREALGRLDLEGVDLAGVHAHLGRHTSAVEPFRAARAASGRAGRRAGARHAGLDAARDRPRRRLLVSR